MDCLLWDVKQIVTSFASNCCPEVWGKGDSERKVFTKSNSSEEEKRNCIHSHSVQPYQTYISELLAWVSPLWNLHRQLLSWGARQSWGRWVQILNPETNNFSKSYSFEEEKQQWIFLLWLVSCQIKIFPRIDTATWLDPYKRTNLGGRRWATQTQRFWTLSLLEWDGRTPPSRMWSWWTSWRGSWTQRCRRQSASTWRILSPFSTTKMPWNTSRAFLKKPKT